MPKQTVTLDIGLGSNPGRDDQVNGVRHINCHVEELGRGGKAQFALFPAPGLTRFDQNEFNGINRGMITVDSDTLVVVYGNEVVRFDATGEGEAIGTLPDVNRIFMARNAKVPSPQVAMVTSDNQAYYAEEDEEGVMQVQPITNPALPPPNSVFDLDGYTIWTMRKSRRFYISSLDEMTEINDLDYATVESTPGDLLRGIAHKGHAFFFKTDGWEKWYNSGNTFFPFEPVEADSDVGCLAAHSVVEFDNSLVWVDQNSVVRQMRDVTPLRISKHDLEKKISLLSDEDKATLEGSVYEYRGHIIYVLSSPGNWTHEYDSSSQQWNDRESYNNKGWLTTSHAFFAGQHIFGSQNHGRLYAIDPDVGDEDGEHLVMRVQCPVTHAFPKAAKIPKIYADILRGLSQNSSNIHDRDSLMTMRFSKDGARTWSNERSRSTGMQGQYNAVVSWLRNGRIKESGRLYEFTMSSAANRGIMEIKMDVRI